MWLERKQELIIELGALVAGELGKIAAIEGGQWELFHRKSLPNQKITTTTTLTVSFCSEDYLFKGNG